MATSSIPAALDYLVAAARALPQLATPATVHDGYPTGSGNPALAIGVVPHEDGDTPSEVVHAQLGAQMEREVYDIPCAVEAWVGGGEEATKPARDAAFAVFNAVITMVRSDRTLGGALRSGAALVTGVRVEQTAAAVQASEGRLCAVKFVVRCENRF